jgi:hypothetical protein
LIQSQEASELAFCGAGLVTDVAGVVGPVALSEHAADTEATDTSMTNRIVRDIMGSISREHHPYHVHCERSDIAGGNVIRRGTR